MIERLSRFLKLPLIYCCFFKFLYLCFTHTRAQTDTDQTLLFQWKLYSFDFIGGGGSVERGLMCLDAFGNGRPER